MRNILKAATLESKFPLLSVEHSCIVSKDADLTVCYRVELPELFTVASAEYEAMHAAWSKAVKVLPDFSIVHRQEWFTEEKYIPDMGREERSFLSCSFERHFNERPYLNHASYLFLTKTTRERMRLQINFNALTRGFMQDKETAVKFMESCEQFERIINESGLVRITRLSTEEIIDLEMMPVQKRIAENETAEIRCHLLREGNYLDTRYFIRYFQPDGKGELRMDDGTLFKPNDLYPLIRELFRLYYTARSADQQVIDLYLEDSFGQVMRKTIAFDNAAADNKAGMRPFGVLSASAP